MAITQLKPCKGKKVLGKLWKDHGEEGIGCKLIWPVLTHSSTGNNPLWVQVMGTHCTYDNVPGGSACVVRKRNRNNKSKEVRGRRTGTPAVRSTPLRHGLRC